MVDRIFLISEILSCPRVTDEVTLVATRPQITTYYTVGFEQCRNGSLALLELMRSHYLKMWAF